MFLYNPKEQNTMSTPWQNSTRSADDTHSSQPNRTLLLVPIKKKWLSFHLEKKAVFYVESAKTDKIEIKISKIKVSRSIDAIFRNLWKFIEY